MQAQVEAGGSTLEARGFSGFFAQGRLKPGVTMSQAEAELRNIAAQLAREFPNENEGMTVTLSPAGLLGAWMRGAVLGYSGVLMAVVGLVLLLVPGAIWRSALSSTKNETSSAPSCPQKRMKPSVGS